MWYQFGMDKNSFTELIDLAHRSLRAGDTTDAAASFHDAAMVARGSGMKNECAYALRHCAIAELENAKFEIALGDSEAALELYGSLGEGQSLNSANTLRLIALAHEGLEQSEDAEETWILAREIYERTGIAAGVAECDQHLKKIGA